MRKWTNVVIANKSFELNTKDRHPMDAIGYRDIDDCYANPSKTKIEIWKSWERWFDENDGYCTVASYNCNFFTIEGYFEHNGYHYYALITHAHNKCWLVEE